MDHLQYFTEVTVELLPIEVITLNLWSLELEKQTPFVQNWIASQSFMPTAGSALLIPAESGQLARVFFIVEEKACFEVYANVLAAIPPGNYRFESLTTEQYYFAAIAWGLESYRFDKFKPAKFSVKRLFLAEELFKDVTHYVFCHCWGRDLINRPANDLTPQVLEDEARHLAQEYNAKINVIVGDALLVENYPLIHAVGRGSDAEPRLIELRWGDPSAYKITLVGKGVCFDTGGLNIKPGSNMALMRKDMGGAAHVLALTRLIMAQQLQVYLHVLIPVVENAISGSAMRPGDILTSRKGLTIEVTDTDAEGRLILADALAEACRDKPDLLLDIATLTGAARVAFGPEIYPYMTNQVKFIKPIEMHSSQQYETFWQLPLYQPYVAWLQNSTANLCNAPASGHAGAITAGLFLQQFIEPGVDWLHLDLFAWNLDAKSAHPKGGEVMGLRTIYAFIADACQRPRMHDDIHPSAPTVALHPA